MKQNLTVELNRNLIKKEALKHDGGFINGNFTEGIKNEASFINGNFTKKPKSVTVKNSRKGVIMSTLVFSLIIFTSFSILVLSENTAVDIIKIDGYDDWTISEKDDLETFTIDNENYNIGFTIDKNKYYFYSDYIEPFYLYLYDNDTEGIKMFNFYIDYKIYINSKAVIMQNFSNDFFKTFVPVFAKNAIIEMKLKPIYLGKEIIEFSFILQTEQDLYSTNPINYSQKYNVMKNDTTDINLDGSFSEWDNKLKYYDAIDDSYNLNNDIKNVTINTTSKHSYLFIEIGKTMFFDKFEKIDEEIIKHHGGVYTGNVTTNNNIIYDENIKYGTLKISINNKDFVLKYKYGNIYRAENISAYKTKNLIELQIHNQTNITKLIITIGNGVIEDTFIKNDDITRSALFLNKQYNIGTRGLTNITNLNGSAPVIDGIVTQTNSNEWKNADVFITNTVPKMAIYITHDVNDTFIGIILLNNSIIDTEYFTLYFNRENEQHNSIDINDFKFNLNSTNNTIDKVGNETGNWADIETYFNASISLTHGNVSAEFQINNNYVCNAVNRTEGGIYNFGIEVKNINVITQYIYYPSNNSGTNPDIDFNINSSKWDNNNYWSERTFLYGGIPPGTIVNYVLTSVVVFDGKVTSGEYSDTLEYTFGISYPVKFYIKHDNTYTYIGIIVTTDNTTWNTDKCDIYIDYDDNNTLTSTDMRYQIAVKGTDNILYKNSDKGAFALPSKWKAVPFSSYGENIKANVTGNKRTYEFKLNNLNFTTDFINGGFFGLGVQIVDGNGYIPTNSTIILYSNGNELTAYDPNYRHTPSMWSDGVFDAGIIPEYELISGIILFLPIIFILRRKKEGRT